MIFDFAEIAPRDRHKLLTSTVVPRPIAWVSTLSAEGVANIAPFAFFNVFGDDPPTVALGIHDGSHGRTDTGVNIRTTREFVINLVPQRLLREVNVTALAFPPEIDEFDEAQLTKLASVTVRPPRIAESPVSLECVLAEAVQLGPTRWIAIGQVRLMHVADEAVRDASRFHIDTPKLDLVARVEAGGYARIGERLSVEQPVLAVAAV